MPDTHAPLMGSTTEPAVDAAHLLDDEEVEALIAKRKRDEEDDEGDDG